MDEEPNEHELEERLYAMIHHVDQTQTNTNTIVQNKVLNVLENIPRSNSFRRYWHTSGDQPTAHQKINTPKPATANPTTKLTTTKTNDINSKPKEEKHVTPEKPSVDLSLFQSPPQIVNTTIEILDQDNTNSVLLESSDEDEVIEVEVPPKPTITIESSDDDEVCIVLKQKCPSKDLKHLNTITDNTASVNREREVSASPVPSVVSSVSDDFIRNDCIAFNISSKRPDNHSFDFSLHGSDLLGQVTPSKKKKKKKPKETATSTPVVSTPEKPSNPVSDICFATPKNKAKNKKETKKLYTVSEKIIPNADLYDSDSNQSVISTNNNPKAYKVTDKSVPNADVYESDSSQAETIHKTNTVQDMNIVDSSDSNFSDKPDEGDALKNASQPNKSDGPVVDLTGSDNYITLESTDITESIVMANVTGFEEVDDYEDEPILQSNTPKLGSTKVPQILFENLDFDNLKGNDNVCKRRRYSLTTLRAEMEKFYNESWGGEDFNHREIQKYMSRDKSLWVIDPKDRMPALNAKRKVTCNYCNRPGHRDDTCRMKPPVCYMCGSTGHYEPRCPSKICVNCGSPNHMYSSMCRNCSAWTRVTCGECGQGGHPASHCPDLWRRYHNTIDNNTPLVESRQFKKGNQLYCSGCTRRGHLVHACRSTIPFSGLPVNSPYVALYRPVYLPTPEKFQDQPITPGWTNRERSKRQSKSPTTHENHANKKRNVSLSEAVQTNERNRNDRQRKNSQGKCSQNEDKPTKNPDAPKQAVAEKTPDFIPVSSSNHDKKGQIIQDNEVSDTSDVVTSSRIYVVTEIIDKLKTEEGESWLKEVSKEYRVLVEGTDGATFLVIKGKVADQEAFRAELREWSTPKTNKDVARVESVGDDVQSRPEGNPAGNQLSHDIPKKRCDVLRKITQAIDSLKYDLGDPDAMYKELNYLQKKHDQLLKQNVLSPQTMSNNRSNMTRILKNLNMVLLGQAGLAGGAHHLKKLYFLQEKLTQFRQKNISPELRREIGLHYHTIFDGTARDDYVDLLKRYKGSKNLEKSPLDKKKKKPRKKSATVAVPNQPPPFQAASVPRSGMQIENSPFLGKGPMQSGLSVKRNPINIARLTFYHHRIVSSRPAGAVLKKTRSRLANQLHRQIASLYSKEQMSSKTLKKVKKMQHEAQTFLSNV